METSAADGVSRRQQPPGRERGAARPGAALVLTLLGLSWPVAVLASVADYVGRPIVSVRLELEGRDPADPAMEDLVETSVGQPLALPVVRESILHLASLGRFQDVQVVATSVGAGVALVYRLVPARAIERVVFRGDLGLSEGTLRRTVVERYGQRPSIGVARDVAQRLEDLLVEHGYLTASVTALGDMGTDGTVLMFDVTAGIRARIAVIDVLGRPQLSRARLLDLLDLSPGDPYDRSALEERLTRRTEVLRDQGYYEATAAHTALVRENGRLVDVTVEVDPGPLVSVVFEGDPLPLEAQGSLVPIREEGSVDEDLLEDAARRVRQHLEVQGYWKASVEFRRVDLGETLTVVFEVDQGRRYVTGEIDLSGNVSIPEAELRSYLSVQPGDPFVESTFDDEVARILGEYRRRGFAEVDAEVSFVEAEAERPPGVTGSGVITPRLVVHEGPQTLIRTIRYTGNADLDESELTGSVRSRPGASYDRPRILEDRDAILVAYLNRGFLNATVDVTLAFSSDRSAVDVTFGVIEGPRVLVDHIIIIGNTHTSRSLIERELVLRSGEPLRLDGVVESQQRLRALGLFRQVRIDELTHADRARRDLLVIVDEAAVTSIAYGGGLEAGRRLRRSSESDEAREQLEFAPRGFFEIGRRNLWGKNRSIDLFTRISVRPDDSADPQQDGSGLGFSEYRVLGTYREPRAFGLDADIFVTSIIEQAIRSSFNFIRRGIQAELARTFGSSARLSTRYALESTRLFDERINPEDQLLVDRLFPQVRLSTFSSVLVQDTRDDPLDPKGGGLAGIDGELAGRAIGSQVGFAKTLVQGFLYRRLPGRRGVVVALGARLGLARGFPREVARTEEDGEPVLDERGIPQVDTVEDLPASERFFAGGDTTVRGFALDRLGDEETIDQDGFPKGGQALVIFNGEIRVPVWRDIGAVAFLDVGNVFATVSDLDLTRIRGGAGFGVRYRSPIGPIRVDLGFKLDRREFENGGKESLTALHISIGQAF